MFTFDHDFIIAAIAIMIYRSQNFFNHSICNATHQFNYETLWRVIYLF